jgi:hypothetical protein
MEHDKLNLDCLWRCGGLKRRSGLGVDLGNGWYRAAPRGSNEIAAARHCPIRAVVLWAASEAAPVNGHSRETIQRAAEGSTARGNSAGSPAAPHTPNRVVRGRDSSAGWASRGSADKADLRRGMLSKPAGRDG